MTITSLHMSSIPAEVEATPDCSDQSLQITSSASALSATSPAASATPSADAPRE